MEFGQIKKLSFLNKVLRHTMFFQIAITFIALIKVWADDGFGNITSENILFTLLITLGFSLVTSLMVCTYEKHKSN